MQELLRTEKLKKYFGVVSAADNVDLTIEKGVLTSIIGPNGAGKTTLINLLTGNILPDSGRVFFNNEEITHLPTHKRVKKGICRSFQIMNIFSKLSVYENLQIPVFSLFNRSLSFFHPLSRHTDVNERVEKLLREIGLFDKKDLLAGTLSHGDQRLLEIALAMAPEPNLLFLDEPTAGMNPVERVKVLENIRRLSKEKQSTFVIVEHDMDIVFSLSDRIVVLHRGQILADGPPDQIKQNEDVRKVYLGEEILWEKI
ncbi:MAG: ABC transporter ATP-binding protein [Deltaproteobacteria bacterium]|nr:ABC transporter ATP-binding protein [Deltaproteobacteria bacterium]MBM4323271.1 ABC transporter ATP-binding protein [Deltaproteobacteria bacterium]